MPCFWGFRTTTSSRKCLLLSWNTTGLGWRGPRRVPVCSSHCKSKPRQKGASWATLPCWSGLWTPQSDNCRLLFILVSSQTMSWGQEWLKTTLTKTTGAEQEAVGACATDTLAYQSQTHPPALPGEPGYQFCKEETGKLQHQVAAVWPPGCLPAVSQGSLSQEMPHTEMFPSPSSGTSLLCPAHFSPSTHCRSSRARPLQSAPRLGFPGSQAGGTVLEGVWQT